jgi:predicted O-methyltransferase YrrM
MNVSDRVRRRVRMARSQAPGMQWAFARGPLERRISRPTCARLVRKLSGARYGEINSYLREIAGDEAIIQHLRAAEAEYLRLCPTHGVGSLLPVEGALLYTLTRALRPTRLIETGTANGVSTAYFLAALDRNGTGRLVSIDLPFTDAGGGLAAIVPGSEIALVNASPLPPGKSPGWMVPEQLRANWELRLGDARELLPAAVEEGGLDLFFHDSLHTREHMLFEFETAWPYLKDGGVLASDDIFQRKHDAMPAFARAVERPWLSFSGLGFIAKL